MNKTPSWLEFLGYMQTLQLFSRLSVLHRTQMTLTSAGELDLLSRIALSKEPITPLQLSQQMGMKKSSISRLIMALTQQGFLQKEYCQTDKRSYFLIITETGRAELDQNYREILKPIQTLYNALGEKQFFEFLSLVEQSNHCLQTLQTTPVNKNN